MAKHASLSASGTKEWGNCAGSIVLTALLPESQQNDTNDYARLGTCAHHLLETCLSEGVDTSVYHDRIIAIKNEGTDKESTDLQKKGAKLDAVKKSSTYATIVDQDMEEAVQETIEYVRSRLLILFGHQDTKLAVTKGQMRLETRLTVLVHRDDSFGTGDIILDAWPEVLEIVDYKNGSGVAVEVVEVDEVTGELVPNLQLQSYALGTAEAAGWDYTSYRFTVAQTRKPHSDGRIRSHEVTPDDLRNFRTWLSKAADRVDEARAIAHEIGSDTPDGSSAVEIADALLKAGYLTAGDQCKWCKAKYNRGFDQVCPGMVQATQAAAQMDFQDDPEEYELEERFPQTLIELARVMKWVPVLENFVKAVKAHAKDRIFAGDELPGFKIVRGKSPGRKFINMRQAIDTETGEPVFEDDGLTPLLVPVTSEWLKQQLVDVFGAPEDKLFKPAELRTAPQIEKEVPKPKRKDYAAALLWSPPGSLTMAPSSDPRPEEKPDPATDFEDADESMEGMED